MKRFHVKIIVKTVETYAIDAETKDDAEENFAIDGILIDCDDEVLENEILSVEEASPCVR